MFFLVLVCFASGLTLSLVWNKSKDKIAENERKAKIDAVKTIFPSGEIREKKTSGGDKYWEILGSGFAFEAKGMGFQDKIVAIVGVDEKGEKIKGTVVLECLDTPGLGGEITKEKFLSQFTGAGAPLTVVKMPAKDSSQIQAVTGATISSKAITKIINERMEEMRKEIAR